MAGKIQNQDLKSAAELVAAGATAASLPNDDKIYVTGNSLNKTLKQAITDGNLVLRDANANAAANNLVQGYATTVKSAGTISLLVSSAQQQFFTGNSVGQIVKLPDATTLALGYSYSIKNSGTSTLVVQDNAATVLQTMPAGGTFLIFTVTNIGTAAGVWDPQFITNNPMTAAGDMIAGGVNGIPTNLVGGFTNRILQGNGSALPSWTAVATNLKLNDNAGTPKLSVDPVNRKLMKTDGTTTLLDWSGTNVQTAIVPAAATDLINKLYHDNNGISAYNYIPNGLFEVDTTGWAAYKNSVAGVAPDAGGTGGSPTTTITQTSSSPLVGAGSGLITVTAANLQGEGVSAAFTLNIADQAKMLRIAFDYQIATGAMAAGDYTVWIYDVTNSLLIQPTAPSLQGAVVGQFYQYEGYFQSSAASTSYRLILHRSVTTAAAATIKLDRVFVGAQAKNTVSPVSDWVAYTPVITGSSSNPTTSPTGQWRRAGSDAEIMIATTMTGEGSGYYEFSMPTGLVIDSSKITLSATVVDGAAGSNQVGTPIGNAVFSVSTAGAFGSNTNTVVATTTGKVAVAQFYQNVNTDLNQQRINIFGSADGLASVSTFKAFLTFKVPIAGWGSSVTLGQASEGRMVAVLAVGAPQASYTSNTAAIFGTVTKDTHNAYSATTGLFTAPVGGYYQVSAYMNTNVAVTSRMYPYINNVQTYPALGTSTAAGFYSGSGLVYLNAGQTLAVGADSSWTASSATGSGLSIALQTGPSIIAPTETIAAAYNTNATTSYANNTYTTINYATKEIDTHGAVTVGASWVFTAPAPGIYQINGSFSLTPVGAQGWYQSTQILKNGSAVKVGQSINATTVGTVFDTNTVVNGLLRLVAGDTIAVQGFLNAGANRSLSGSALENYVSILRVGL